MKNKSFFTLISLLFGLYIILTGTGEVSAHCDSYDGPVIKDAQLALDLKDVTPVLKWVAPKDETVIKALFAQTVAVRDKGKDIQKIADVYFFESLVRIHRASEGESFKGLKPAGSVSPAVAGADKALEIGNIDQFADKIAAAVREGIRNRFNEAYERKKAAGKTIKQGREYVESYVQLTHFVEGIHQLVSHGAPHNHQ
ncbi:MAG: DUF6448 family protein [Desulfobacterales bacterium]